MSTNAVIPPTTASTTDTATMVTTSPTPVAVSSAAIGDQVAAEGGPRKHERAAAEPSGGQTRGEARDAAPDHDDVEFLGQTGSPPGTCFQE